MDISLKPKLIEVYRRYGFHLARDQAKEGILVFTLKTGYFDNAEIVKLHENARTQSVFNEFTTAGFACTVRLASSPENAEEQLFRGFFSVSSTRQRLLEEYKRFTNNIISPYGPGAHYSYIKSPYQINGEEGNLSPPEEVAQRINDPEPILFLIEAAAGFGKTCAALEIVRLLAEHGTHLPLYAELSRHRQARIFRYVLLDEIDRTFPLLSSSLVQTEIRNGRVATILDGFDELLRKSDDAGAFENKEPMLETVSELLTGKAKVVITTRRTVLFDGDEFHQWLDRHTDSFKVIRIRIHEPRIVDWLPQLRLERLSQASLQIESMANPVLLSYLRCIDDTTFDEIIAEPEEIVSSYFTFMLERERDRQDLRMNVENQSTILHEITKDMIEAGYTAEHRDYIVNFILTYQAAIVEEARGQYPKTEKPTREEIANKLASHALLDRSAHDPNKIGFINEFALGNYVANNILASSFWLNDDMRFIEPAVRSYAPRSSLSRAILYEHLKETLPFLDLSSQVEISVELLNKMPTAMIGGEVEGLTFTGIDIGDSLISNIQFNDCVFQKCFFYRSNMTSATFLQCRFYDCTIIDEDAAGPIYVLGSVSTPDITALLAHTPSQLDTSDQQASQSVLEVDKVILKKFWPIGESFRQKPSRPIYKPVKFLCQSTEEFTTTQLYESVERLQKQGILVIKSRSNLITISQEALPFAQNLLGAEE